jgi:hypothetical protein
MAVVTSSSSPSRFTPSSRSVPLSLPTPAPSSFSASSPVSVPPALSPTPVRSWETCLTPTCEARRLPSSSSPRSLGRLWVRSCVFSFLLERLLLCIRRLNSSLLLLVHYRRLVGSWLWPDSSGTSSSLPSLLAIPIPFPGLKPTIPSLLLRYWVFWVLCAFAGFCTLLIIVSLPVRPDRTCLFCLLCPRLPAYLFVLLLFMPDIH